MLNAKTKKELEKQHYKVIGDHSAVKTCSWTRKMIKDEGQCYKFRFYGIKSNQCLQMTTSLSCGNRCIMCWRDYKAPFSEKWKWKIDEPENILNQSLKEHYNLLTGIKGYENANLKLYEESKTIKHAALSLTGEPIIYPKINELIELFNKKGISVFLVTKGQYPEQIKKLRKVTQLYLSVDAPDKELLRKIDKPLFKDYYERLLKSLNYLKKRGERTCIRLTMIKDVNMLDTKKYSELIKKGEPDFIEVKAYMHLGASRKNLKEENMPLHEDIVEFSKKLEKNLEYYKIVSEHIPSRVVLLAKKRFYKNNKWMTWIDFEKYTKLINSGKKFEIKDYWKEIPKDFFGISGKGTRDCNQKV